MDTLDARSVFDYWTHLGRTVCAAFAEQVPRFRHGPGEVASAFIVKGQYEKVR